MERTAAAAAALCGGICFPLSWNSAAHFPNHHPQLHSHLNSSLFPCSVSSSLSSLNSCRRLHSPFLANFSPSASKFVCHSLKNVGNSALHASCNSSAPAQNAGNSSYQDSRFVCHSSSSSSADSEQAGAGEQVRLPEEEEEGGEREADGKAKGEKENGKPRKAFQSSWDAKDSEGKDYLYRLGKESDNLNVSVGARAGVIDHIFVGNFLGKDSDIVFDYRQKVTRSLKNLTGDYYIAPAFLDKVVTHIAKNYLVSSLDTQVPLLLGIWGGKGQGKSFQLELICKALDMEPIILSAGELESEWAGEPGKLIRERYRTAAQVIKTRGKMSALVINDLDAGIGRFENTQCTVNNQMVVGSLMNIADNPTRVSIGQVWREADVVNRVPIIVTGNDLSKIWAPLIRDGRMDKFYWQPTREDIVNIVYHMYLKDGLSMEDIGTIVDTYPNQALDFYGALRSRSYDKEILKWIQKIGGAEKLAENLVSKKKNDEVLSLFEAPEATVEKLLEAGNSLAEEQRLVNDMRLSDVYMKKQTGPGISLLAS